MNEHNFKSLSFHDKAANVTAISAFILGWIISFVGLFLPPIGEIDGSVITVSGIGLSYAATLYLGVSYLASAKGEIYAKILRQINADNNTNTNKDNA